ncbi:MAG: 4-phosphoerythronate dehydrogenase [Bacteroidales bacterium]|nr:4-phosphoerythronate dehydrogenase [Bacteroidales bacterium]
MKLVADSHIPYLKGVFEPFFDVEYLPGHRINQEVVKDADVLIIRTRTICNQDLLQGSRVKFIASATIGYDHIDTQYCDSNGIRWVTAPGCNAAAVQQWVGAALVKWISSKHLNPKTLTIGIVGIGNVGSKVVTLGNALGMNVVCCDPPRAERENIKSFVDLHELLKVSDIITFHVPLTRAGNYPTYNMLSSKNLALCKPTAYFLNSSRGGVVDEVALLNYLEQNPKVAVALDVWENEPDLNLELAKRCLVATPHIAGYSLEGKVMATKMVVDAVSRYFNLDLTPWWPTPNPLTIKQVIGSAENILDLIGKTYRIESDDIRIIAKDFEDYRNTYNYRRDFTGYKVLKIEEDAEKVGMLGFELG